MKKSHDLFLRESLQGPGFLYANQRTNNTQNCFTLLPLSPFFKELRYQKRYQQDLEGTSRTQWWGDVYTVGWVYIRQNFKIGMWEGVEAHARAAGIMLRWLQSLRADGAEIILPRALCLNAHGGLTSYQLCAFLSLIPSVLQFVWFSPSLLSVRNCWVEECLVVRPGSALTHRAKGGHKV